MAAETLVWNLKTLVAAEKRRHRLHIDHFGSVSMDKREQRRIQSEHANTAASRHTWAGVFGGWGVGGW